jgi:hypothetical protein
MLTAKHVSLRLASVQEQRLPDARLSPTLDDPSSAAQNNNNSNGTSSAQPPVTPTSAKVKLV